MPKDNDESLHPSVSRFLFRQGVEACLGRSVLLQDATTIQMVRIGDEVRNLAYFVRYVCQAGWEINRKNYKDDIAFRITKWSESVVFFLASSVPQGNFYEFRVEIHEGDIVFKDGWNIRLLPQASVKVFAA